MSEFEWSLIELRSESLTEFFTLMPFMAGSVFYMYIIAIGFCSDQAAKPLHNLAH